MEFTCSNFLTALANLKASWAAEPVVFAERYGTLRWMVRTRPNHITGTLDPTTKWIGGPETNIKLMRDQQVATASGAVEQFIQQLQLLLSVRVTEAKHTWIWARIWAVGRWPDKNIKTKWTKNTLCATHTIFSIFRDGLSNQIWFVPHFLQLCVPCVIAQSPSIGTCGWQAPPLALKPPRI